MKLWDKGAITSAEVHAFTVGNDREMDKRLAPFDVQGTLGHSNMLFSVGLLSEAEHHQLVEGLNRLKTIVSQDEFEIPTEMEDIHSYIEFRLTEWYGETGKKVHTARSRNDQVATALQLYLKDAITQLMEKTRLLGNILCDKASLHEFDYIPGYTHTQVAMPSSIGMWLSAYAECLADDLQLMQCASQLTDQNPLGTAAGYGSTFPIDREHTTDGLGFSALKINPIAAQLNRGKLEQTVAFSLAQMGGTTAKLANDCVWMLCQNFSFISFPDSLTTGSSIMPHKKNPDVFELIRAKSNQLSAIPAEINAITRNLVSGYHRDFQLLKEPLFRSIDQSHLILDLLMYMMPQLEVKQVDLSNPIYSGIFSVDAVAKLVQNGRSFREAYIEVGQQVKTDHEQKTPLATSHIGSLHALSIEKIRAKLQ